MAFAKKFLEGFAIDAVTFLYVILSITFLRHFAQLLNWYYYGITFFHFMKIGFYRRKLNYQINSDDVLDVFLLFLCRPFNVGILTPWTTTVHNLM